MFLYSNLLAVSEETTEVVKWVSVGGVLVLLAVIGLIGFLSRGKQSGAKELAFAGVCVGVPLPSSR